MTMKTVPGDYVLSGLTRLSSDSRPLIDFSRNSATKIMRQGRRVTMTSLRVLSPDGLEEFENYLIQLKADPTLGPPSHLLEDTDKTKPAPSQVEVESQEFRSKLEFGLYITKVLNGHVPEHFLRT